jgi:hypothetical protein
MVADNRLIHGSTMIPHNRLAHWFGSAMIANDRPTRGHWLRVGAVLLFLVTVLSPDRGSLYCQKGENRYGDRRDEAFHGYFPFLFARRVILHCLDKRKAGPSVTSPPHKQRR